MKNKEAGFSIFETADAPQVQPAPVQQQPQPEHQPEPKKDEWLSIWNDALFVEVR